MSTAEKSLKRLHHILQQKTNSKPYQRTLRPRHTQSDVYSQSSIPPQKNRNIKGRKPLFYLSKSTTSKQLLQQSYQIKRLNEQVMKRVGLPFMAHIRLSAITSTGIAIFHANSPAWLSKGRFLQRNLIDLLHQEGATGVKQVKLKVRYHHDSQRAAHTALKHPTQSTAQQLADESRQSTGRLSQALQRLSNTLLRST